MQPTLSNRFGHVVRALRQESGLSQVVFAERCGFYQTYLSRIETGKTNPMLNAIEIISEALGISVFDLFDQIRDCR